MLRRYIFGSDGDIWEHLISFGFNKNYPGNDYVNCLWYNYDHVSVAWNIVL